MPHPANTSADLTPDELAAVAYVEEMVARAKRPPFTHPLPASLREAAAAAGIDLDRPKRPPFTHPQPAPTILRRDVEYDASRSPERKYDDAETFAYHYPKGDPVSTILAGALAALDARCR